MADELITFEDEDGLWIETTADPDDALEVYGRVEDEEDDAFCCCDCPAVNCHAEDILCECGTALKSPLTVTITISGNTSRCGRVCTLGPDGVNPLWARFNLNGSYSVGVATDPALTGFGCGWGELTATLVAPVSYYTDSGCSVVYAGTPFNVTSSDFRIVFYFKSPGDGVAVFVQQGIVGDNCAHPVLGLPTTEIGSSTGDFSADSGTENWNCCATMELPAFAGGGTVTIEPCGGEEEAAADESEEFFEFVA